MEEKFCKHCGKKIPKDSTVCPKCGRQVSQILAIILMKKANFIPRVGLCGVC